MFTITPIPAFKDNYIWLLARDGLAFVVDPGDAAPVIARLDADALTLAGILVTHHHADHQGGIAGLLAYHAARQGSARHQALPVLAPASESITATSQPLNGGEVLDILGQPVEVLALPGHTRGHLGFLAPGALFCGDVLFGAGCGRLFEGTPAQMLAALERIAALPETTQIYCAHEYTEMNLPFALTVEAGNPALQQRVAAVAARRAQGLPTVPLVLAEEKATNPFLRCAEPAVVASALAHAAVDGSKLAVFTALRQWRNEF